MLMCEPCSARRRVRRLKQIGKTQRDSSFFLRHYRCLACLAALVLTGAPGKPKRVVESWRFAGIGRTPRTGAGGGVQSALVGQIPVGRRAVWR